MNELFDTCGNQIYIIIELIYERQCYITIILYIYSNFSGDYLQLQNPANFGYCGLWRKLTVILFSKAFHTELWLLEFTSFLFSSFSRCFPCSDQLLFLLMHICYSPESSLILRHVENPSSEKLKAVSEATVKDKYIARLKKYSCSIWSHGFFHDKSMIIFWRRWYQNINDGTFRTYYH